MLLFQLSYNKSRGFRSLYASLYDAFCLPLRGYRKEEDMKLVSLKTDYVFKEVFSRENVRKQFLSDVLGIPLESIRTVRIANSFLLRQYRWQKEGIIDMSLELNDDTCIDLELQVKPQKYWYKRQLFYLARIYAGNLRTGQNYDRLRKCISIGILDFKLRTDERYHTKYTLRSEDGAGYPDLFEIHTIELGKPLSGEDAVDDWIRLFNARSEEDLAMIGRKSIGITEAIDALRELSLGRKLRYLFEMRQKAKRDRWAEDEYVRDEGIAIGRAQGKAEGKAEDILELLADIGEVSDELRRQIMKQKDIDVLSAWHRLAARSRTVKEFEKTVLEEQYEYGNQV